MAITIPSTNIQLFGNLNLSPNYENTLYFASTSAKDSYFDALPKKAVFSSCYYQRENRNYIRVQTNIANIYNSQYMRFQNPDFENKWFYAFVTSVDYINNNTTEVGYSIDYMMTWMGSFTLNQCFIERMHVRNDSIGANIADENLPCGEYVNEDILPTVDTSDMSIVILYADSEAAGQLVNNLYQGAKIGVFKSSEVDLVNRIIQTAIDDNRSDNIVGIYMIPTEFAGTTSNRVTSKSYNFSKPYDDICGYVPKNKKLFCFPYKYCLIDNMEGGTQVYQYEYFHTLPDATSSGTFDFTIEGVVSGNAQLILHPQNYKQVHNEGQFHGLLGMSHFPICSWSINSYEAWLAQKNAYYPLERDTTLVQGLLGTATGAMQTAASGTAGGYPLASQVATPAAATVGSLIGTAILPGAGTVLGGVLGGIAGGLIGTGASMLSKRVQNEIINTSNITAPDVNHGEQATDVLYALGKKTFLVMEKCITKNYAMMIDDYFTMYGYAIRQVGTPSMNIREHFTFVKTIGCSVAGELPAYDAQQIENIFDNGCRFWKDYTEIGNYDLDNSTVVG